MMWKVAKVAYFKSLFHNSLGRTEENNVTPHSWQPVSGQRI